MASSRETFDSREGHSRGIGGIFAARKFFVTMDDQTHDPIAILTGTTANGGVAGARIGEMHPNANYPVFVKNHIVSERLTETTYIVEVIYGTFDVQGEAPIPFPELPGWQFSIRGSNEQEEIRTEFEPPQRRIPGQPPQSVGTPAGDTRLIGVPFFQTREEWHAANPPPRPLEGEPPPPPREIPADDDHFEAKDGEGLNVRLVRLPGLTKSTPIFLPKSGAEVTFKKTVIGFTFSLLSLETLEQLKRSFNDPRFIGMPRGTVRFVDWSINTRMSVNDQGDSVQVFDIVFSFKLDMTQTIDNQPGNRGGRKTTGFDPHQVIYTYDATNETIGATFTSLVTDTNITSTAGIKLAHDNFTLFEPANYCTLMALIDTLEQAS